MYISMVYIQSSTNINISLTKLKTDKKNENKEVAVDDFLPASAAFESIQQSM